MELVMPMNYEVLDQEEMMYLDGGGRVTLTVSAHFLRTLASATAAGVAFYVSAKYFANSSLVRQAIYTAIGVFIGDYLSGYINRGFTVRTPNLPILPNWTIRI